jgi:hypothetical protein
LDDDRESQISSPEGREEAPPKASISSENLGVLLAIASAAFGNQPNKAQRNESRSF